jgi:hypothetical protein
MNELIQELAGQAGEYVNSVYTPPVRSKTPGKIWEDGHIDWHTQFNQKFAELIVRNCIVDFYRNYLDTTSDEDITKQVDRYVKQQFGVEE